MVGTAKAVFLDRDGVLSIPEFRDGRSFAPKRAADFRLYPDAAASVARLKAAGYLTVVATNQPDVGNGSVARSEVEAMHAMMQAALPLDAVKVCYHRQGDGCACRKPAPGMLHSAATELGLDLPASIMIGDRASDVEAGRAAGCGTLFIDRGYTAEEAPTGQAATVASLAEAVEWILDPARAQSPAEAQPVS